MSDLLSILNRRKRSKEFTEGFREGATPEELEYYNQFYQEPTASPIMQRDELGRQLDETEAMRRALMARGMNTLQANDAVQRAKKQREAAFGHSKELYQQAHPDEGPGTSDELSYQRYAEDYAPYTQTDDQGVETVMTGDPMSQDDFLNRQIARQRLAGDTSAAAKAEYDTETLGGRIEEAKISLESLPALVDAKVIEATLGRRINEAILKEVDILESTNDPTKRTESIQRIDGYNRILGRLRSSGTAMPGQDPNQWTDADKKELETLTLESEGATAGTVGGTRMITPMPTTEAVSGDYSRGVSTRTPGQQSEEGRAAAIRRRNRD